MKLLEKIFAPRQIKALERMVAAIKSFSASGNVGITRTIALIVIVAEMLGVALLDTPQTARGQELDLSGYNLVFEDEFEGDSLDTSKWEYRSSGSRRGGFISPSQVWIEDGNLIIRGEYLEQGEYGEGWYSGMIRTIDEYIGGYFEVKCICSKGGGFWSAFWLNSTGMASAELSNGGLGGAEIDIFEAPNYKNTFGKDSVALNVHVGGYGDGLQSAGLGSYYGKNIYAEYNTYGFEWTEEEYIFYINGVEADRNSFKDGVSQVGEYIILSLCPPNEFSEEPGFATDFIIDYVRVYQKGVIG
ncbi:MAG TPA: glycoside hydrolase family 16 protein [Clostridia bacterium]|nr:glycoside hydrolase family 16 protein [Clostridia bacterium]